MTRFSRIELLKLAASTIGCQAAGFIGAALSFRGHDTWYRSLVRPSFTPPDWVFAPVWTALFLMMAVAIFLIWRQPPETSGRRTAATLFLGQLFLNVLWSPAFFALHSPLAGMVVIILLWTTVILTTMQFARVSRAAAALMAPYALWVGFAVVLNVAFFRFNP